MTTGRLAETLVAAGPRRVALVALGFGDPPERPDVPTVAERDRDAVFTALAAELARWLQGRSPTGELSPVLARDLAEVPGAAVRAVAESLYAKDDPILAALGRELFAVLSVIDADGVLLRAQLAQAWDELAADGTYREEAGSAGAGPDGEEEGPDAGPSARS